MASQLIVPKKEKPFDIAQARKDSELAINIFKVLGYTLDFSNDGTIIFTNDGSRVSWYVSNYQVNSISISDHKTEFRFSYTKQEDKSYKATLEVVNIFGMLDEDCAAIDNAIGIHKCKFKLNID